MLLLKHYYYYYLFQFIFRKITRKVDKVQKMVERVEEANNTDRESEEIEMDQSTSEDQAENFIGADDSPSRHVILTL